MFPGNAIYFPVSSGPQKLKILYQKARGFRRSRRSKTRNENRSLFVPLLVTTPYEPNPNIYERKRTEKRQTFSVLMRHRVRQFTMSISIRTENTEKRDIIIRSKVSSSSLLPLCSGYVYAHRMRSIASRRIASGVSPHEGRRRLNAPKLFGNG